MAPESALRRRAVRSGCHGLLANPCVKIMQHGLTSKPWSLRDRPRGRVAHRARATYRVVVSGVAAGVVLVLAVWAMGAEAAPATGSEKKAASAGSEVRVAEERLGPVHVRPFKPMRTQPIRLRERHTPVYFRSPFAEPAASDRDVDRCVPLACGAAVADWMMFTFRALGFPVEMAVAPPWQTQPLGR